MKFLFLSIKAISQKYFVDFTTTIKPALTERTKQKSVIYILKGFSMPHIRKRGKKGMYYIYRYITVLDKNGNKKRKLIGERLSVDKAVTKEAVRKKTIEEDVERLGVVKRNVDIDEFFNRYCIEYSENKKRPLTIVRDKATWRAFKRICPEIRYAHEFTDEALTNYKIRRRTGSKGRLIRKISINRELGLLKNLSKWGYKQRYLASNYYDLVEKLTADDSIEKKPFTDEQIQRLISYSIFPYNAAYILACWQGMRRSEICFLERTDFNWVENTISINPKPHLNWFPKTKKSARIIPIHPNIRKIVKQYWDYGDGKSNFFLFTRAGEQLLPDVLSSQTYQYMRELKFPKGLSIHNARHTFATRIQEGGAAIHKASKLLGHSNTLITEMQYTHFKDKEHFDAINAVKIKADISVKLPKVE